MFDRIRLELGGLREQLLLWACWYVASLGLIVLTPSYWVFGESFWSLSEARAQSVAMGVLYLGWIVSLRLAGAHFRQVRWTTLAGATVLCLVATGFLLDRWAMLVSGRIFLMSGALALLCTALPLAFNRHRKAALAGMTVAAVAFVSGTVAVAARDARAAARAEAEADANFRQTHLHGVTLTWHSDLVPPKRNSGGAIATYEDGFLIVTGVGEFFSLSWDPSRESIVSKPLSLVPASFNRESLIATEGPEAAGDFRITDILLDEGPDSTRAYLAHHHWKPSGRCITMRVSRTILRESASGELESMDWETVFEAEPCLRLGVEWRLGSDTDLGESGGRLAFHPGGGVLFTVGDHASDGLVRSAGLTQPFAQQTNSSYGKIWWIDNDGTARIFTAGHRNPQGLLVDRDGRIWSTEHGPKGGDELNLIVEGRNYGWPYVTYGTDYARYDWPLSVNLRDHGAFEEPAYVWVPSIGPSQVIQLSGRQFPSWSDDLLVASLRAQTLFRVRMNDSGPVYAEPIQIGARIRDLEQGSRGRIVLWTDDGAVVSLRRASDEQLPQTSGAILYETRCSRCHEPPQGSAIALGPSLNGLLGRPIASEGDYAYSAALRELGGVWSSERLDQFLADPADYAPGTTMDVGMPSSDQRQALIEFLADFR